MESTEIPKAIAIALAKAQANARAVEKTSTNEFSKYRYASAESVITEARAALHSVGLALLQLTWDADGEELVVRYLLILAETGETWEPPARRTPILLGAMTSEGKLKGQPADKAAAVALTYNLAYTLRGLLLLARVAEGTDADQRDDGDHAPPTFEAALAACKTPDAVRKMLWRHRERIGEEVSRETGTPLILAACERVKLTPAAGAKAIASIWGESGASSPDGAPSGDRD